MLSEERVRGKVEGRVHPGARDLSDHLVVDDVEEAVAGEDETHVFAEPRRMLSAVEVAADERMRKTCRGGSRGERVWDK